MPWEIKIFFHRCCWCSIWKLTWKATTTHHQHRKSHQKSRLRGSRDSSSRCSLLQRTDCKSLVPVFPKIKFFVLGFYSFHGTFCSKAYLGIFYFSKVIQFSGCNAMPVKSWISRFATYLGKVNINILSCNTAATAVKAVETAIAATPVNTAAIEWAVAIATLISRYKEQQYQKQQQQNWFLFLHNCCCCCCCCLNKVDKFCWGSI